MRLTWKNENGNYYEVVHDLSDIIMNESRIKNKLGQLEDIEDEYGIELVTLFKALKRGAVWVREHNTKDKELVLEEVTLDLNDGSLRFRYPRPEIGKARNLFDYGNSWANTKEELK